MNEKKLPSYQVQFSDNKYTQSVKSELENEGFVLEKSKWILNVD